MRRKGKVIDTAYQINSLYENQWFAGFLFIAVIGLVIGSYFLPMFPDQVASDLSILANDSSTTQEILESVEIILNATNAPAFTDSPLCDDGNPCTMDGRDRDGFCVNIVMENGESCSTPCGVNATCQAGQCVPGTCSGNCETSADCPDFIANDGSNDPNLVSKSCIAGMCVFQTSVSSDMDDIDLVPAGDNALARQICFKSIMFQGLNQTMGDQIITPVSACMEHVGEKEMSGDLLCSHYFKCSCPEPVINPIIS